MKWQSCSRFLTTVLMVLPACSGESSEPLAGGRDGGSPDASVEPDGSVAEECPPLATTPTLHDGDVQGEETWSAADSPHVVERNVNVRDGATLTIEPCAVVRFAAGASLNVAYPSTPNTGTLVAEGTADRPIRFEALTDEPWDHVLVYGPGTASFAYVTITGAGGPDSYIGESIRVLGDGELPSDAILKVDHVTIEGSRGPAIQLSRAAKFTSDSRELTVRDCGVEGHPFPIELGELAIDSLPTGSYTGNLVDEILIDPQTVSGQGGLLEDATMRNRGVPYRVGHDENLDDLVINAAQGMPPVTLTIEAGVTLKFLRNTGLEIEHYTGTERPASGVLRAIGTEDAPVVFTSAAEEPAAGDWRGLWYGGLISADNRLEHVRIEYTGADCSCTRVTCSANVEQFEAAIILNAPPPSVFLTNSVITHSAGHGIVQGYDGPAFDWATSNTFSEVAGCRETLPRDVTTACPDPEPECVRVP